MHIDKRRFLKIKNMAHHCLKYFNTINPLTILQYLGVELSLINLDGNLGGFTHINTSNTHSENTLYQVYINSSFNSYSQKIIAAHELGHVLLHNNDELNMFNSENSIEKEYEANIFTMELLTRIQPIDFNYLDLSPTALQKYISTKIYLSHKKI